MEKLKDLDKLTEHDPRHDALVSIVPETRDGIQQLVMRRETVADRYAELAVLELNDSVPEAVHSAFAVTRMLWLFGYYYWPLYTLAESQAILCLNMALATRIAREDGIANLQSWRVPDLPLMFKRAIESKWVTDDGIAHAKRLRERSIRVEELFGVPPDLREESPQRYCRILLEGLTYMRNAFAHPKDYWHGMPGSSFLTIENVHDLIQQLFCDEVVKS
jgi:hypothetical protein